MMVHHRRADVCVCSVISRSYVPFADVLARSIREHHADAVDVLICVVDGLPEHAPEGCIAVDNPRAARTRRPRGHVLPLHPPAARDRQQGADAAGGAASRLRAGGVPGRRHARARTARRLLDADAPEVLFTPHLLEPLDDEPTPPGETPEWRELNFLRCGVINGAVISVAPGARSTAFLDWLTSRLRTTCQLDLEHGLHFDQTWLDLAYGMFGGLELLRDVAYNVAYWNLPERPVTRAGDGSWLVRGEQQLRLYHFSGYDPRTPQLPTR